MKRLLAILFLLPLVALAQPSSNIFSEVDIVNGLTLGGVRNTAWPSSSSQTPTNYEVLDFKNWGGHSDGIVVTNAWITSGSTNLFVTNNAWAGFSAGDIGKSILIRLAGNGSDPTTADLSTTITSFTDSHHVGLASSATTTQGPTMAQYGTDDTSLLQSAIIYCLTNNPPVPVLRLSGITILNGAFQDTNTWNSIIEIPYIAEPFQYAKTLAIVGAQGPLLGGGAAPLHGSTAYGNYLADASQGTWIMCNTIGVGVIGATTGFPPSIFCAGTNCTFNNGAGSCTAFNNIGISFQNIGIRTSSNPMYGALNFFNAAYYWLENVAIDSGWAEYSGPIPNSNWGKAFGLIASGNGNDVPGVQTLRNVEISGFYNGLYAYEHTDGDCFIDSCINGLLLQGGAPHNVHFSRLALQSCAYGIVVNSAITPLYIDCCDIEHDRYPTWATTVADIYDTSNLLKGSGDFTVYSVNSTTGDQANGTLVRYGGTNFMWNSYGGYTSTGAQIQGRTIMNAANLGDWTGAPSQGFLVADLSTNTHSGYSGGGTNAPPYAKWTTLTSGMITNALGFTGSTSTFLRSDGTQATPSGSGNMVNTGTPITDALPEYSDTTGTAIDPSKITIGSKTNLLAGTVTASNLVSGSLAGISTAGLLHTGTFAEWTNTSGLFTAGTSKFLREDGTMQTPSGGGNVTTTSLTTGKLTKASGATSIADGDFAAWTNTSGLFTTGTSKFLREDGTMQTPSGGSLPDPHQYGGFWYDWSYGSSSGSAPLPLLGYSASGSGATYGYDAGGADSGQYGAGYITTGTTTSGAVSVGPGDYAIGSYSSGDTLTNEWRFQVVNLPDATNPYRLRFGFFTQTMSAMSTQAEPSSALYWLFSTNDTHMVAYSSQGGTSTNIVSGTTINAGTWYVVRVAYLTSTTAKLSIGTVSTSQGYPAWW